MVQDLDTALRERLRTLRESKGWSRADLARHAREIGGLDWNAATVGGIERGIRRLNVGEVFAVAFVLGVGARDLLPAQGRVKLAPDLDVAASALPALWEGTVGALPARDVRGPSNAKVKRQISDEHRVMQRIEQHAQVLGLELSVWDVEAIARAGRNEAERQAADKLGIDVIGLSVAAHGLWTHSLTEERDIRAETWAPGEITRARRAAATRAAVAELVGYLRRPEAGP